jgi:hypothetical protein
VFVEIKSPPDSQPHCVVRAKHDCAVGRGQALGAELRQGGGEDSLKIACPSFGCWGGID